MDELYIKTKDLTDYKYIKNYFCGKDIISIQNILDAFDWELKQQNPDDEDEIDEIDKKWAYECEQAEERELQEHFRGE